MEQTKFDENNDFLKALEEADNVVVDEIAEEDNDEICAETSSTE